MPKVSRGDEITKIKVEINKKRLKIIIEKMNKTNYF